MWSTSHRQPKAKRLLVGILTITAVLSWISATRAGEAKESDLKAAFLYNFAKFTEWPGEREATRYFLVGIYRPDRLSQNLDHLTSESVRGRPIRIRTCTAPSDALNCHLVYVNTADDGIIRDFVEDLRGKPVLVISDARGAANLGAMIGIFTVEGKLRFEINMASVESSGLKMSAHLLGMARIVRQEGAQP